MMMLLPYMFLLISIQAFAMTPTPSRSTHCQRITIPLCQNLGYNFTFMPNHFKHDSQHDVDMEVRQFWPLVDMECSPNLRLFLCTMYAPICGKEMPVMFIPPCHSLCQSVKNGCGPIIKKYSFPWPRKLTCDKLPEDGANGSQCITSDNLHTFVIPEISATAAPNKTILRSSAPIRDHGEEFKEVIGQLKDSLEMLNRHSQEQTDLLKELVAEIRALRQDNMKTKEDFYRKILAERNSQNT